MRHPRWLGGAAIVAAFAAVTPVLAQACTPPPVPHSTWAPAAHQHPLLLGSAQLAKADRMISYFEDSRIQLWYSKVEKDGDGRGFTVGRGFTTGTGDAAQVVHEYCGENPHHTLCRFLPRLDQLAKSGGGDVRSLEQQGFPAALRAAAKDLAFRRVQNHVVAVNSYLPAMRDAAQLGVHSPLGRTILYDTVYMHGEGSADGTNAIIRTTIDVTGGTPRGVNGKAVPELTWLRAFIAARKAIMECSPDVASQATWRDAVSRADALAFVLRSGDLSMQRPLVLRSRDFNVTIY